MMIKFIKEWIWRNRIKYHQTRLDALRYEKRVDAGLKSWDTQKRRRDLMPVIITKADEG